MDVAAPVKRLEIVGAMGEEKDDDGEGDDS